MSVLEKGKKIGTTWRNAGRLKTIVGVFVRHGFQNIAVKMKLERFSSVEILANLEQHTMAERARMSFEELGPTFVKLGQLLASRSDLVPENFVEEFKQLQDQVHPEDFSSVRKTIEEELGDLSQIFTNINEKPLGSASIAQAHRATLKTGEEVIIKVQRRGIAEVVNDDLGVLHFLAQLLEKHIPESRASNPVGIANEFARTLQLEMNFIIEANNVRRFYDNFENKPAVKIPQVHLSLCTEKVLVQEFLEGEPLSQFKTERWANYSGNQQELLSVILRSFMEMVFRDGIFHGDMHAGNVFVYPNNCMGLVDFGVVGRLNSKTQKAIANMLVAIATEDYDRLAYEYVELSPFSEKIDIDVLSRDLRGALSPYYGLTLKNVNTGLILMNTAVITSKHGLILPSELILFFRSLMALENLGHLIKSDFDLLDFSLDFASDIVKHRYDKEKMGKEFSLLLRESTTLLYSLPRQIKLLFRKINSPDYTFRLHIEEIRGLKKEIGRSSSLIFLGLIISGLVLSSSILVIAQVGFIWFDIPIIAWVGYGLSCFYGFIAFIRYIRR